MYVTTYVSINYVFQRVLIEFVQQRAATRLSDTMNGLRIYQFDHILSDNYNIYTTCSLAV